MKHLAYSLSAALCLIFLAPLALAQTQVDMEDTFTLQDRAERERIAQTRANHDAISALQEAQCYSRFAVNDCLIKIRTHRREVLGDLRRQEIALNDMLRKRRGADQLLRSDAKVLGSP